MNLTELLKKFDQNVHKDCGCCSTQVRAENRQLFSDSITQLLNELRMEKEDFNGFDVSDNDVSAECAHEGYRIAVDELNNKIEEILK